MICAGIDAGSRSIKVVLLDFEAGRILGRGIADQGVEQERLAAELFESTCHEARVARAGIEAIVATGYGRKSVRIADTTITEITCHARGVHQLAPDVRTIIEIGGQDSKCLTLEDGGRVRDFAMNDRCAAGSGRFLEVVAARLNVDLVTLGELSRQSQKPALISSMCVVFAETEIIGLLAEGIPAPDIAAGVQNAIAQRVVALAARSVAEPVYFTGGVALQPGMTRALEAALACPVKISPLPQFTGALGAAILAGQRRSSANAQPRGLQDEVKGSEL
jgi:(R)-2-hydroxyacyl-CoA dehydratese activating ATPase